MYLDRGSLNKAPRTPESKNREINWASCVRIPVCRGMSCHNDVMRPLSRHHQGRGRFCPVPSPFFFSPVPLTVVALGMSQGGDKFGLLFGGRSSVSLYGFLADISEINRKERPVGEAQLLGINKRRSHIIVGE